MQTGGAGLQQTRGAGLQQTRRTGWQQTGGGAGAQQVGWQQRSRQAAFASVENIETANNETSANAQNLPDI